MRASERAAGSRRGCEYAALVCGLDTLLLPLLPVLVLFSVLLQDPQGSSPRALASHARAPLGSFPPSDQEDPVRVDAGTEMRVVYRLYREGWRKAEVQHLLSLAAPSHDRRHASAAHEMPLETRLGGRHLRKWMQRPPSQQDTP